MKISSMMRGTLPKIVPLLPQSSGEVAELPRLIVTSHHKSLTVACTSIINSCIHVTKLVLVIAFTVMKSTEYWWFHKHVVVMSSADGSNQPSLRSNGG